MEDLQQLINDCANNNRLSQEKLYRKFYPALFLMCKRFFALEAMNDGMMKVYKNIGKFRDNEGTFYNWIYTIVRNSALDKLKLIHHPPPKELSEFKEKITQDNPLKSLE